jgi:hypothetical protein
MQSARRSELILFLLTAAIAMGMGIVLGQGGSRDPYANAFIPTCTYSEPREQPNATGLAASLLGTISPNEC